MKESKPQPRASKRSIPERMWKNLPLAIVFLCVACASGFGQAAPNFGPNVHIFTPGMSSTSIQSALNSLANEAQFSANRFAVFFMPGAYSVQSEVGYYESIAGLGQTPNAVTINGFLTSNQTDSNGNLTTNFWRSLENMAITSPTTLQWGVAQGTSFRRMLVNGPLELANTSCGFASGGFIGDSQITGTVNPCSQQQWYTRNSSLGGWTGGVWNMVFSGVQGAPAQSFPNPPETVLPATPVSREKPFLYVDSGGNFNVFAPALKTNSSGTSWAGGNPGAGNSLPIGNFFIAQPSTPVSAINAALVSGQNLILTPGIYQLTGAINITNPNTIVLGLGYATLVPQTGAAAITVADVDGVQIADLIIDAGPVNSPVLLQVGVPGAVRANHQANPASLDDVYFRIGGGTPGSATVSLEIDSNNVILDNVWGWRADHGNGVGWTQNTGANGLVVNGDNVTALGLFVEHYQKNQVVWNGNGGETIFYQSELPYDVPSQAAWMNGSVDGYSSYSVSSNVLTHQAFGLGVYSFFDQGVNIVEASAITVPVTPGVAITGAVSVFLNGMGSITNVVDNVGAAVGSGLHPSFIASFGGQPCASNCPAAPAPPANLAASAVSSSQINLSWTASATAGVLYNVFRSQSAGFTPSSANQIGAGLTATSLADANLAASTTYFYAVEAVNAAGSSAPSSQASATTLSNCFTVPSVPGAPGATATSSSQISLNWGASTAGAGCTVSYNVFRSQTAGFTPAAANQVGTGVTATSFADANLAASTTYFYMVEAMDAAGASAASGQASATTQSNSADILAISSGGNGTGVFAADMDFSGGGTFTTGNSVSTAGVANAAPMAVYQSERAGVFTYTLPNLTAGASYTVRLHFAEIFFTAAGKRIFNVSINGTAVLSNFDIVAAAGGPNIALVEPFAATANSSGQILIGFTNGTADQPKVSGIELLGNAGATPPAPPANLTATATSASQINLSWTASATPGVTYSVFSSATAGFVAGSANLIARGVSGTSFSNTGLNAATTFFYVVEANNQAGNSAPTAQASATTTGCASNCADILAINSGGNGTGVFAADTDFSGGGTFTTGNSVSTAGVANAAPMAVYQSERAGVFTYTLPNLTAGASYTVRLHFAEIFFTATGKRIFNVSINGTAVLSNFDIVAAAGGPGTAVVEQFAATANSSGQIVIGFTSGAADQPKVSGIELR